MKINPRVPGDIPLMAIGYKCNSWVLLAYISTEGSGITDTGGPYLSRFSDNYYSVSICPVFSPCLLGRYLNACVTIENDNRM